ncbi:MAG: hypothetical protein H0X26_08470 [Alphaproteobacteria bacterium]|nr:hypothetical protein [Alphaproteobacteria bacterium]
MNKLNIILAATTAWVFVGQANAMDADLKDSSSHIHAFSSKYKFDKENLSSEANRKLALELYRGAYQVMQSCGIDYDAVGKNAPLVEAATRRELGPYSVSEEDRAYCKRGLSKELQTDKDRLNNISNTLHRTQDDNWWLEFQIEDAVKRSIDTQDRIEFQSF